MSFYKKLSQVLLVSLLIVLAGYSFAAPKTDTSVFTVLGDSSPSQIEIWLQQLDAAMSTLQGMQNQLPSSPLTILNTTSSPAAVKENGPSNNPNFYTQTEIDRMLADLRTGLNSLVSNQYLSITQMIAGTNQIDQLNGVTVVLMEILLLV